jgi:hypothetical protein
MAFIVPDQRPASLDTYLALIAGKLLKFAVPFTLTDDGAIQFREQSGIGVEQFADISASGFLALPVIYALGSVIPKQDFPFEITDKNRITRLFQQGGLFRDLLWASFRSVMSRANPRNSVCPSASKLPTRISTGKRVPSLRR